MSTTPSVPYIKRIEVNNLRPIRHLVWELPEHTEPAGWHVIIGDNGAGKSTFLEAVALGLLGSDAPLSLRLKTESYIRKNSRGTQGCRLTMVEGSGRRWDANRPSPTSGGRPAAKGYHASFGAVRRFVGSASTERLELSDPTTARHASLFDRSWALGSVVTWLKDLALDARSSGEAPGDGTDPGTTLSWVKTFVNQEGLLPNATLIDVTSEGPIFEDGEGHRLGIEALSDGYQSAVGLTLEILRQLYLQWPPAEVLEPGEEGVVVGIAGVVLIDEVDAHLHPTWQQRIGQFFCAQFPRIQFIVTTHSPLVCRAAEKGTIFRLPRPGTDEVGSMVTGQDRDRLLYGDVLAAYGTEVFGAGITRSERGQQKFDRLAELNVKARFGVGLPAPESDEREQLQALLVEDVGK